MNEVMNSARRGVMWNPWNKVVQAHDDGTVSQSLTDLVRRHLGLPVPWRPEFAEAEVRQPPTFYTP